MRSTALLFFAALWVACSSPPPAVEAPPAAPAPREVREENCLNAWLRQRGLNAFGDPQGQAYTGGTPLFDERTGARLDRREYVYRRHPDAKQACAESDPHP